MLRILIAKSRSRYPVRSFSSAPAVEQGNYIQTDYMVNNLRVQLRMPSVGQMWFFVDRDMSV